MPSKALFLGVKWLQLFSLLVESSWFTTLVKFNFFLACFHTALILFGTEYLGSKYRSNLVY